MLGLLPWGWITLALLVIIGVTGGIYAIKRSARNEERLRLENMMLADRAERDEKIQEEVERLTEEARRKDREAQNKSPADRLNSAGD